MAAHRYWRLLLGRRSGVAAVVTEVQMRTSIGGANAATGGAALSSTPGGGTTAANAFDGNTGTSFQSGVSDPAYVGYDFGTPVSVVEVLVTLGATAGTTPYSFIIDYSDDGSRWTSIANYDISSAATNSTVTVSGFPSAPTGRIGLISVRFAPWLSGPPGRVVDVARRYDASDGGSYRIRGTVAITGSPNVLVRRRVRVFNARTSRCVAETWSDPVTGFYTFNNLRLQAYFVVAEDYQHNYRAVIADNLTPELMP